jgi:hypothetical protein
VLNIRVTGKEVVLSSGVPQLPTGGVGVPEKLST